MIDGRRTRAPPAHGASDIVTSASIDSSPTFSVSTSAGASASASPFASSSAAGVARGSKGHASAEPSAHQKRQHAPVPFKFIAAVPSVTSAVFASPLDLLSLPFGFHASISFCARSVK